MDALSQIFEELHISETQYFYLQGQGNWHCSIDSSHIVYYLVMQGQCILCHEQGENSLLNAGDLVMLTQGKKHYIRSTSELGNSMPVRELSGEFSGHRDDAVIIGSTPTFNCKILCFQCHVDVDMARPLLSALPSMILIDHQIQTNATEWIQYVFQFLALEASSQKIGKDTLINRLAGLILIECIRYHIEHLSEDSESWLLVFKDPALFQAMNAIHQHLDRHWTVAELAQIAHMSRSSFAERFTQKIGMPPLTYLYKYRLRVAAYYLRKTNQSSATISEKLGYASENSFCLSFKKNYGLTPSLYRKSSHQSKHSD